MEITEMPKRVKRTKRLFVPVTAKEHQSIMQYCKDQNVRLTDLVRFALKQTFDL